MIIQNVEEGHALIDRAVSNAMRHSKPVYISICCNLAGLSHPTFDSPAVPFSLFPRLSNPQSLRAAVKEAAGFLNKATRPVSVGEAAPPVTQHRPWAPLLQGPSAAALQHVNHACLSLEVPERVCDRRLMVPRWLQLACRAASRGPVQGCTLRLCR